MRDIIAGHYSFSIKVKNRPRSFLESLLAGWENVFLLKNIGKVKFCATCNLKSSRTERGLSNLDHILHYLFSKRIKLIREGLQAGDNNQAYSDWLHCPHRNLFGLGFFAPTKLFFKSRRHFCFNVLGKIARVQTASTS